MQQSRSQARRPKIGNAEGSNNLPNVMYLYNISLKLKHEETANGRSYNTELSITSEIFAENEEQALNKTKSILPKPLKNKIESYSIRIVLGVGNRQLETILR